VVEVGEDHFDALVLLTEDVLDGDPDVVEGDEGRSGGTRVTGLDLGGLDTFAAADEQNAQALVRLDGGGEVIRKAAVSDPPGNRAISSGPKRDSTG